MRSSSDRCGTRTAPGTKAAPGGASMRFRERRPLDGQSKPNLVLLCIGTNDMNRNYEADTAPQRLAGLIDQIHAASPQTAIEVASLVPAADRTVQARANTGDRAIPGIVADRAQRGSRITRVSMGALTGPGPRPLSAGSGHPLSTRQSLGEARADGAPCTRLPTLIPVSWAFSRGRPCDSHPVMPEPQLSPHPGGHRNETAPGQRGKNQHATAGPEAGR